MLGQELAVLIISSVLASSYETSCASCSAPEQSFSNSSSMFNSAIQFTFSYDECCLSLFVECMGYSQVELDLNSTLLGTVVSFDLGTPLTITSNFTCSDGLWMSTGDVELQYYENLVFECLTERLGPNVSTSPAPTEVVPSPPPGCSTGSPHPSFCTICPPAEQSTDSAIGMIINRAIRFTYAYDDCCLNLFVECVGYTLAELDLNSKIFIGKAGGSEELVITSNFTCSEGMWMSSDNQIYPSLVFECLSQDDGPEISLTPAPTEAVPMPPSRCSTATPPSTLSSTSTMSTRPITSQPTSLRTTSSSTSTSVSTTKPSASPSSTTTGPTSSTTDPSSAIMISATTTRISFSSSSTGRTEPTTSANTTNQSVSDTGEYVIIAVVSSVVVVVVAGVALLSFAYRKSVRRKVRFRD